MPERITLSRAKGWRMPPNTVSVARGPGRIWGNLWTTGYPAHVIVPAIPGELPEVAYEIRDEHGPLPVDNEYAVAWFRLFLTTGDVPDEARAWRHTVNDRGLRLVAKSLTERRATILRRLPELRGKNLACWCKPGQPCHADVLLELANAGAGE